MLSRLRRRTRHFFRKTRTLNNEPINKVSLVVIVLVDIFILVNVFWGLYDIGNWPLSPAQAYPCHTDWSAYRNQTDADKDFTTLRQSLSLYDQEFTRTGSYQQLAAGHWGQTDPVCLQYAALQDQLNTPENQQILTAINNDQTTLQNLEAANQEIRQQYDSTLLEEIAGQPRDRSINPIGAAEAKAELDANSAQIATLKGKIADRQQDLLNRPESQQFLGLLQDDAQYNQLDRRYNRATFWYPTQQIFLQGLFLLPLIGIAWTVHSYAQRRNYGLLALLSWHLLVIFWVPLIVKLFQILQIGALYEALSGIISAIVGGLLFVVSYVYIFLIPLIGFGLIKFFQNIVFNPKLQAAGRVQQGRCIRCARKLQPRDLHCPHCGFAQDEACPTCHQPTYRLLPHCRHCGAPQNLDRLV
jgi:hypothetical protein